MIVLENQNRQAVGEIEVHSYDCNRLQEMTPTAMLRYAEEVADEHLGAFDMPYARLHALQTVFLLTAVGVRVIRPPRMREKLRIVTWQRTTKGAQFFRETEMVDQEGQVVVEGTANWVLVDTQTHKIKRPSSFALYQTLPSYDRVSYGEDRITVRCPQQMQAAGTRIIRYSDIDYNRHLNNTRYADLMCDFIPGGLGERRISEFRIVFSGEALEGDEIAVSHAWEGDWAYVKGVHARGRCFEAACRLA